MHDTRHYALRLAVPLFFVDRGSCPPQHDGGCGGCTYVCGYARAGDSCARYLICTRPGLYPITLTSGTDLSLGKNAPRSSRAAVNSSGHVPSG